MFCLLHITLRKEFKLEPSATCLWEIIFRAEKLLLFCYTIYVGKGEQNIYFHN